jgi:uncharacterized repeat protein (TIGR02543 family)
VDGETVKTVNITIPEGQTETTLPPDAVPTDSVIAGHDPQSTSQILGWIDTKDETKTIYTTDESLAQTEGYAPIGSFVVSEDTTFEAVFPSVGGVAEGRGGQPGEISSSEDTSGQPPRQATPATPPTEGNSGERAFSTDLEIGTLGVEDIGALSAPPAAGYEDIHDAIQVDEAGKIIAVNFGIITDTDIFIPRTAIYSGNEIPITGIADNIFLGKGLTGVQFANDSEITSIGNNTFQNNPNMELEGGFLPTGLTTLGNYSFSKTGITSVDIPNGVQTIGEFAFEQCLNLENVILREGLKSIRQYAFYYCATLKSLTLPDSVTSLSNSVFAQDAMTLNIPGKTSNQLDITSTLNGSKKVIVNWKDNHETSWWYIDDTTGLLGGLKENDSEKYPLAIGPYPIDGSGALEIPSAVDGVQVKSILPNLFSYYDDLKSLTFASGSSITEIPRGCFTYATSLVSVVLPDSVIKIAESAFSYSNTLATITLPANLETIDATAFYRCSDLSLSTLPNSVESIGASAFAYGKITISAFPTNLTYLGGNAFQGCGAITSMNINDELTNLPGNVFVDCVALESVTFGYNTKISTIAAGAFPATSNLQDIWIEGVYKADGPTGAPWNAQYADIHWKDEIVPAEVKTTADGVWTYNTKTHKILGYSGPTGANIPLVIPTELGSEKTAITGVGGSVFKGKRFESVIVSEGIEIIGDQAFYGATFDGNLTIPASMVTLESNAFRNCQLTSLTFANESQLTSIGAYAFQDNKLTQIVLPDSLETISFFAFRSNLLGSVTFGSSLFTIKDAAFYTNLLSGTINLPASLTGIEYNTFGDNPNITEFIVDQFEDDATASLKTNRPYGVPSGIPVYFNLRDASISKAITKTGPTATVNVTPFVQVGEAFINTVKLTGPEGPSSEEQTFNVPGSTNTLTHAFTINKNGRYAMTGYTTGGVVTETFDVDIFGKITLNASNTTINISQQTWADNVASGHDLAAALSILDGGDPATAIALDYPTDDTLVNLFISNADLEQFADLDIDTDYIDITVKASYTDAGSGVYYEIEKPVRITMSGKVTYTYQVRAADFAKGIGQLTDTGTLTGDSESRYYEYTAIDAKVKSAKIPTAEVLTPSPYTSGDVTFIGWYRGTTLVTANPDLSTAFSATDEVGSTGLTFEARFKIDTTHDGVDDRDEGRVRFVMGLTPTDAGRGTLSYGGSSATLDDFHGLTLTGEKETALNTVSVENTSSDWEFAGWSTNLLGTGPLFGKGGTSSNELSFEEGTFDAPVTYYAIFNPAVHFVWDTAKVTDAIGFEDTYVPVGTTLDEASYTLPTFTELAAYEFQGWSTTTSVTDKIEDDALLVATVNSPTTYTAIFAETTVFSVIYDAGIGGTLGNETGKDDVKWSDDGLLPTGAGNIPTRTGYRISEWQTSDGAIVDGDTKYSELYGADPDDDAAITLTAQWTEDFTDASWKTVTFNSNGGNADGPSLIRYNNVHGIWADGTTFPTTSPTRAGYTFSAWNAQDDGKGAVIDKLADLAPVSENTIVYATWTVNSSDPVWAKVSFDANGGTGAPSDILYNTSENKLVDGVSFPTTKPSRSGYKFASWNTKANGNGSIVNADNLAPSSNITLYAVWNANGNTSYKVEHYLVDAGGSASLKETVGHTAKTDTTANATAKSYEHYTLNSAHNSAISSGNVAGDGSLVLKLYYGINHNVVSYSVTGTVPEGAPAAPAASDVAYGQTVNVASALTFDGYTFSGWNADGVSGSSFTMPDSAVAFTGSWTLIDNGGGDNGGDDDGTGGQNDGNDDDNNNGNKVVDEPKEPEAPKPSNPSSTTSGTETSRSFAGFTAEAQQKLEAQTGNVFSDLGNGNVPLGSFFAKGAWSLLSAVMSIAAVVISLILAVGALARRRREDEHRSVNTYGYEDSEKRRRNGKLLKALTCLAGVATFIVWIGLDDFSQPMAWVNSWTLFVGLVFIAQIALLVIYKLRSAGRDSEYEEDTAIA